MRYQRTAVVAEMRARRASVQRGGQQRSRTPVVIPGSVWALAGLVLLFVVSVLWLGLDNRFYVGPVRVEGTRLLDPLAVLTASELPGWHVLWIPYREIEERVLQRIPAVQDVDLACRLPADCTLTVVERQPVAVWESEGAFHLIDASGTVFPAESFPPDVQLIRGPLPAKPKAALAAAMAVGLAELKATGVELTDLIFEPRRGFSFVDRRGWRVVVGQGSGMAARLELYEDIARQLEAQGIRPGYVDVHLLEAPYYSLQGLAASD